MSASRQSEQSEKCKMPATCCGSMKLKTTATASVTRKSVSTVALVLIILSLVDLAVSDYENTWNLYYEQPCCGGSSNGHHIRHHRGNF